MYSMYTDSDIVCDPRVIHIVSLHHETCGLKTVVCDDEILISNVNFFMIPLSTVFDYHNLCQAKHEMRMLNRLYYM